MVLGSNGKTETLLRFLALRPSRSAPREMLLDLLWPDGDLALAAQSMNSLVYSLRKQFGDALAGASPVLYEAGSYRLNHEAGIATDIDWFSAYLEEGEMRLKQREWDTAAVLFQRALKLYHGDLLIGGDTSELIKREYLRASYLSILNHLADNALLRKDDSTCLKYTRRLLEEDPFRETAHRLAMLCYVMRGERASALRQFKLCQELLEREYDAAPEPATVKLYEQIRLNPASFSA